MRAIGGESFRETLRLLVLVAATCVLIADHAMAQQKAIEVMSPGVTMLHAPSGDAIHIGDNEGNIDDIRHVSKTFHGDKFNVEFLLKQVPAGVLKIGLTAASVASAAGGFICKSTIYVNDREIGQIENGERSYDVDRAILKSGPNTLTLVSETCVREDGGYTSGIDDIVIKAIKITTK